MDHKDCKKEIECKHKNLEYCPKCKVVWCKDCKKEWPEKEYIYPYNWTYTYQPYPDNSSHYDYTSDAGCLHIQ